jgi:hypothetical protein
LAGGNDGPGGESMPRAPVEDTALLVLPTGEAVDLSGPDDELARAFDDLRQLEAKAKEVRALIADELRRRMDRRACWTTHTPGFKVTAPSPAPKTEYDADALGGALVVLMKEGLIDAEAAAEAIKREVTYKPVVRQLNQLRKLGGRVQEVIDACAREVEPTRNVSVQIKHGGNGS